MNKGINMIGVLQNIALLTLIYNIYNNNRQLKLEKKRYWYREHVVKELFPYLKKLKPELEKYISEKEKYLNNKNRNFFKKKQKVKKEFNEIKGTIEALEYFVSSFKYFEKNNILKKLEKELDLMDDSLFDDKTIITSEELNDFYTRIKKRIYIYEKNNYKIGFLL